MMAGGQTPDVVWFSDRMIPQFMASGKLVNLAALKEDPEYAFADINPGSFGCATEKGKAGLINLLLRNFPIQGPVWLFDKRLSMLAAIVVTVFKGVGMNMVILLAALYGVPETCYIAVLVTGCTLFVGSLAGYAFAKLKFPGRDLIELFRNFSF
jgi:hypothetical protein